MPPDSGSAPCGSAASHHSKPWITFATAGLLALTAAVACLWRPDILAALTLIPAWCWLVPGVVSALFAWRTRNNRFACALTVLWIVFAIGWFEEVSSVSRGIVVGIRAGTPPAGRVLRIVSLNCANDERCASDLKQLNADIVLIQEAPGQSGLEKMGARLFGDSGSVLAGGDTAILARGEIDPLFVDRSAHFVAGLVRLDDGRAVRCVSLRLTPPISRLDFWAAGFWSDHRDLRGTHRRQLRQVIDRIAEIPSSTSSALVVGGDFNAVPRDRALDELRPQLGDAFLRKGVGWGATGTNNWPLFRVDQIWTDSRLDPLCVSAVKTVYSDHRMVACDAVLRN